MACPSRLAGGSPSLGLAACGGYANHEGFFSLTALHLLPQYRLHQSEWGRIRRQWTLPPSIPEALVNLLSAPAGLRFQASCIGFHAHNHCDKVLQNTCFASGSKGALQSCFLSYFPGTFFPYLIQSPVQFEPKNELFYFGVLSSFSNIDHFYYMIYVNRIN